MAVSDAESVSPEGATDGSTGRESQSRTPLQIARDLDWAALYIEAVGAPQARFHSSKRRFEVTQVADVSSDVADDVVKAARENGLLVRKNGVGFVPPDEDIPEDWNPVPEAEEETDPVADLHEQVQGVGDDGDSDLAELVQSQMEVIDHLTDRIDDLESEVEEAKEVARTRSDDERDLRRGVTELQVRELQNGAMLGREQVDLEALHEAGLDVEFAGSRNQFVRLSHPESEGDTKASGAGISSPEDVCKVEHLRQLWRRGLTTRDDMTAAQRRAMLAWNDLEKMAGTSSGLSTVKSVQVKRTLVDDGELEGMTEDSKTTAANQACKDLPRLTDGLVQTEKDGNRRVLRFDLDDVLAEKKETYGSADVDGGDIITSL